MKILLVHKFFNYNGGADVFFFEVGRVLKEHGHEIAYFSTNSDKNLKTKWSKYFIDAPDFKSVNPIKRLRALYNIPYNKEAKKRFADLIDDFKPDLIHCFNIMTHISPSILFVAREKNIPVVISLNDYKHICPCYKLFHHGKICAECRGGNFYHCVSHKCAHNSIAFSLASAIESYVHSWIKAYDQISLFLFASDFMAEITESFWGKKLNRGKLMNPFNVPAAPEYKEGDYGLFFGRLIDEKGVDILLKAIEKSAKVPFVIVGNGPEEDRLKEYVKLNKIDNVKFVGPKWGDELEEILNNCRFVVVPSTWHENFPYVILQAFAAGKPVIGTKRGGIPEMINSQRGYLYDADDIDSLSNYMRLLWDNPSECITMGKAGRKYVEETFNDDKFYNEIVQNYNKVLDTPIVVD